MDYATFKSYLKARITELANLNNTVSVYDDTAGDNSTGPYIVFNIPIAPNDLISTAFQVDIHFWDETGDDTTINQVAKDVRNGGNDGENDVYGLRCSTQVESEGFYKCDMMIDTHNMTEKNSEMSHLLQSYQITVYESN